MSESLIIFSKIPEYGLVKTRIAAKAGKQQALEIHLQLTERTINVLKCDKWNTGLYYQGDASSEYVSQWGKRFAGKVFPQRGLHLGEKMLSAISTELARHSKVVIVGTDCPYLQQTHIEDMFAALDENDVAIIPAKDGGYVAIASRIASRHLFPEYIRWGSGSVMKDTLESLRSKAIPVAVFPELEDIDYYEDYCRYRDLKEGRENPIQS